MRKIGKILDIQYESYLLMPFSGGEGESPVEEEWKKWRRRRRGRRAGNEKVKETETKEEMLEKEKKRKN